MVNSINQKGVSLIAALFIIVILAFMGLMFLSMISTSTFTSLNDMQSTQAFSVAEGGMERAVRFLDSPILDPTNTDPDRRRACASVAGDAALTNAALGPGQFTVTTEAGSPFYPAAATTLSAPGITPLTSTINVNSSAGYAPSGRIMIDRELIDYSGIIGNSFTGAVRGRDGSIAVAHANGASVGQYQCTVTSQGGIPTMAAPAAMRTVREGVQLQEGWVVGGASMTNDNLNSVQCTDAANCWATGDNGTIVRWNGVSWSEVASPTVENLNEVHCADADNCWAVGDAGGNIDEQPLFLQWDGTAWTQYDSTPLGGISENLNSVYCVSANDCWAVGTDGAGAAQQPLIFWWNGATWATRNSNLNINSIDLSSVYCVSWNDCWAVGTVGAGAAQQPFILWWNGLTWATRNSNLNINNIDLNSVACAGANACWAVGEQDGDEVIFRWNLPGPAWSRVPISGGISDRDLNSVTCADPNNCWAVGDDGGAGESPWILRYAGGVWNTYNTGAINVNTNLNSVTCSGINDCWAVGDAGNIFHWNGAAWIHWPQANATLLRWRDVDWTDASGTLPSPPPELNGLNSASMLSYADGWAVGNVDDAPDEVMFRWDGAAWNRVGPIAGIPNTTLNSVYCVSTNDCWAVGNVSGGNEVIIRWTGGPNWARVGPVAAIPNTTLNSVYCASTNDCWAVGNVSGGNEVIIRWTGGPNWARVGPAAAIPNATLNSVYCVSANDCWAVGNVSGGNEVIIRWQGGPNWTLVGPSGGIPNANLNSVYCVSTNDCWAVGNVSGGNEVIIRWTGGPNWARVGPYAGVPNSNLNSVTCIGTDDCWAAGNGGLVIHWDGATWIQIQSWTIQNLQEVYVIGPRQRPQAAWQEVVQ